LILLLLNQLLKNADGTPGTPPPTAGTPPAAPETNRRCSDWSKLLEKVVTDNGQIIGPLAKLVAKS